MATRTSHSWPHSWDTSPKRQDAHSVRTYWRNARSRTVRVLDALTPEDLEWAPIPGAFTFGDQAGCAGGKIEDCDGKPALADVEGNLFPIGRPARFGAVSVTR